MRSIVYVIAEEGQTGALSFVKIGVTGSLTSRLGSLQTGNPRPLRCLGIAGVYVHREDALRAEAELHTRFRADRVSGEWFRASADVLAFARALSAPGEPIAPVRLHRPGTFDGLIWCPECGGEPYTVCAATFHVACIACGREGAARTTYDAARSAWNAGDLGQEGSRGYRSQRPDPAVFARRQAQALEAFAS